MRLLLCTEQIPSCDLVLYIFSWQATGEAVNIITALFVLSFDLSLFVVRFVQLGLYLKAKVNLVCILRVTYEYVNIYNCSLEKIF